MQPTFEVLLYLDDRWFTNLGDKLDKVALNQKTKNALNVKSVEFVLMADAIETLGFGNPNYPLGLYKIEFEKPCEHNQYVVQLSSSNAPYYVTSMQSDSVIVAGTRNVNLEPPHNHSDIFFVHILSYA